MRFRKYLVRLFRERLHRLRISCRAEYLQRDDRKEFWRLLRELRSPLLGAGALAPSDQPPGYLAHGHSPHLRDMQILPRLPHFLLHLVPNQAFAFVCFSLFSAHFQLRNEQVGQ